jgi:hypothetical protein
MPKKVGYGNQRMKETPKKNPEKKNASDRGAIKGKRAPFKKEMDENYHGTSEGNPVNKLKKKEKKVRKTKK